MPVAPHVLDARTVVLAVEGEITGSAGRQFVAAAEEVLRLDRPRVIVDVTGASFMDSGGVAALIAVWEDTRRHRGQFVLVVPEASPVRRTLEIRGLAELFALAETRESAVRLLD